MNIQYTKSLGHLPQALGVLDVVINAVGLRQT